VISGLISEEPEKTENHERWLISYADFITLLMVLFVILYSMSQVDAGKYEELAHSLNIALTGGTGIFDFNNSGTVNPDNGIFTPRFELIDNNGTGDGNKEQIGMEQIKGWLQVYFADHGLDQSVALKIDERGLVVSLHDTFLFDPGKAALKSEYMEEIIAVGKALNTLDNYIRVEGHTDNTPINNSQFASNWELSAARATTVVRILTDKASVSPEKLSAVGYGEYKPIADNSTVEGRGKNRRVNIILLSSVYNNLEI